jgi:RimJ/RimL family protein N-acetyltransferase
MDQTARPPTPNDGSPQAEVRLEPWTIDGLDLLRRLNSPEGTKFLGGPETEEKLADRNARYASGNPLNQMFRIIALPENEPAGSVGFWDKEWRGQTVYETGWGVVTAFQGRGIAVAATRAVLELARADGRHRYVHAYPKTEHAASNAVCRKVGFVNLGEADFEYPAGHPIRCNDWRFDLDTL